MLILRALASFLACPAVVAGVVPMLLMRSRAVRPEWFTVSLPVLGLGGFALLWCVRDFYASGRGTLAPWDPPQRLVVVGLYRVTRNPMYVAVLAIVLGWSLLYRSELLLAYAAVLAGLFHWRVRSYEEPQLKLRFGAAWDAYQAAVPRWLPVRRRQPREAASRERAK
jgi:protein-S-isoprenylcysteine O-methyltransferase Ste14